MNVILGKTEVSMLNPPNEGTVTDRAGRYWTIRRTGCGNIALRAAFAPLNPSECHEEFINGVMDIATFCQWINSHL